MISTIAKLGNSLAYLARSTLAITAAAAIAGCGGSGGDGPTVDAADSAETKPINQPESLKNMMSGTFKYDYALLGTGDTGYMVRRDLESEVERSIELPDVYLAKNVGLGGWLVNDHVSPALVAFSIGKMSILSRTSEGTISLPSPAADMKTCESEAVVNSDFSALYVFAGVAPEGESCWDAPLLANYFLAYDGTEVSWKPLSGRVRYDSIQFDSQGKLLFFSAFDYGSAPGTTNVYSADGTELQTLASDGRAPRIVQLGQPGPSADETFVGIVSGGQFRATSARMLMDSGMTGSSAIITGMDTSSVAPDIANRIAFEHDRYTLIQGGGTLHVVDEIARKAVNEIDLSKYWGNSYYDAYVTMLGTDAYMAFEHYESDAEPKDALIKIDVTTGVIETLLHSKDILSHSRSDHLVFINFYDDQSKLRSLTLSRTGTPKISTEFSSIQSSVNLAESGDHFKIYEMASNDQSDDGLKIPTVFRLNPKTGTRESALMSISEANGDCTQYYGIYSVGDWFSGSLKCKNLIGTQQNTTNFSTGNVFVNGYQILNIIR